MTSVRRVLESRAESASVRNRVQNHSGHEQHILTTAMLNHSPSHGAPLTCSMQSVSSQLVFFFVLYCIVFCNGTVMFTKFKGKWRIPNFELKMHQELKFSGRLHCYFALKYDGWVRAQVSTRCCHRNLHRTRSHCFSCVVNDKGHLIYSRACAWNPSHFLIHLTDDPLWSHLFP